MDLERLGVGASVGLILSHRRLRRWGMRVLSAAVREFFLPQFQSRLRRGLRPVAVVSHPLDDTLPFLPRYFRRYLGYFTVWLKTMGCLYRIYGNPVLGDVEEMMRDIVLLYRASGWVYRRCQSTTPTRYTAAGNPHFLLVYLFDPHLHCVPSLHVLTICRNYHRTGETVRRFGGDSSAGSRLAAESYREALRITEATLLVKQHSLLDIGPSLFLLSELFPRYDDRQVRSFVSALFAGQPEVSPGTAERLRGEILRGYEEMLSRRENRADRPATAVILDFLTDRLWRFQQAPP
jgi:hypothetical protein